MTQEQAAGDRDSLKILSSTALKSVMEELGPLFERGAGGRMAIEYGTSNQMMDRINAGETADIALLTSTGIEDLVAAGRLAAGSRLDFAQTGIGLAVRAGAPLPRIDTVDAFKRVLLEARSVTYTATGASGVYFAAVLERLGIADEIRAKAKIPAGGLIGDVVVRGEAELGIQLVSELLAVPGLALAGPLPRELQNTMVFSAGTFAHAAQALQPQAFYRFLRAADSRAIMDKKGMQPI
ncbi:MAG: bacterial extracellular solute-binding family protein [Betaproteobacteria bacterium]|nr:bacterial extracellular solute-binding family protein [Betaproteobacteria bacterium]